MYLFARREDMIDVYEVVKVPELLKEYRKKILDKYHDIPFFYTLKTNVSNTVNEFNNSISIDIDSISYTKKAYSNKKYYSKLLESECENESQKLRQEETLNKYLNGEYGELLASKVYKYSYEINDEEEIYYFLKPESEMRETKGWVFNNVIRLPRELYLLQLIETDNLNRISSDEKLDEQLSCFTKEKIGSASMSELKLLIDTDLIRQSMGSVHEKLDIDKFILPKIKEKEC